MGVNEDARDIQATLNGDGEAYRRLVERHQQTVARRMWRFTRDRRELDELVSDVFVEAFKGLGNFRGDAPLDHWLLRIGTRVGYRFWKRRSKRADREMALQDWDGPAPGDASSELTAKEAAETLHRMLEALPPRDRLVLTLMYLEEMSVAEVADHTGWSETMVKVQAHRARKKLRRRLENSR
jgi:RNA polymerase sigma-70 factor (ECF subfamily)